MGTHAQVITLPAVRMRGYAEKLLVGVESGVAARLPRINGQVIQTNHPTFVFGHLSLYPAKVLQAIGRDPTPAAVPPEWEQVFKAGAPCLDDPQGTIYPPLGDIASRYFTATDAAIAATAEVADALLLEQTPDEKARAFMPTTGARLNFYLNNHVVMHLGQVSAWRRMMGLGSAM